MEIFLKILFIGTQGNVLNNPVCGVDRLLSAETSIYLAYIAETVEDQYNYTVDCSTEKLIGDMVYITDLEYTSIRGHNIAEVQIYGTPAPLSKGYYLFPSYY